jgi:hypothetical protein
MSNGIEVQVPVYDYVNHQKLPISVRKEYWNKGYVTGGNYHMSVREINNLLTKVEQNVKDAVNELVENKIQIKTENVIRYAYINEEYALENERKIATGEIIVDEQGGAFASQDEFVEFIENSNDSKHDDLKKSMGIYRKEYILDYWDEFMKFAPASYNSGKNGQIDHPIAN